MPYNLNNPAACLRVIARQIEKGEIEADVGVLSLRKKGARRPTVFGFGEKVDGVAECGRGALEILRLQGVPAPTKEQTEAFMRAAQDLMDA